MWARSGISRNLGLLLFMVVIVFPAASFSPIQEAVANGSYHYKFVVDEDGFTAVTVDFESSERRGSSWIIVPKFTKWYTIVSSGRVSGYEILETQQVVGIDYYFYEVFSFSFESDESFAMLIQFNATDGAFIINQRGMFFSPQIGFQQGEEAEAEVFFPDGARVGEAVAFGNARYQPDERESTYVLFNLQENLVRLQIEFETNTTPEPVALKQGVFTFQTERRYENDASKVLKLFNTVYDRFTNLFNATLESVNVQFFIPDFETLLSVGGYVPFTDETFGDIYINIFFMRVTNGTLEVIALHELVHHFLWKIGLSPDRFLWFHEGMAQYVSIEIADGLGYEGASLERERLEDGASQLITYNGENFDFLQQWSPASQPTETTAYYVASYYVVSRLAEKHGGLDYYERFFELMKGTEVENDDALVYYLSCAAETSVVPDFKRWGFEVADLYANSVLVEEAERIVTEISPIYFIEKFASNHFYRQALISIEKGEIEQGNRYLSASILIAEMAPTLSIITLVTILATVAFTIFALKRRGRLQPVA